jgi:tellurium resistance protein TerZ
MVNVDLDLSCVLIDSKRDIVDYIYSPYYREDLLARYNLKKGKLTTDDSALKHSGDDRQGDSNGDDGLDNEVITVDLTKLDKSIQNIYFFLNNVGEEDFAQIPYAKLRMYEGTPTRVKEIFASYNVASEVKFKNKRALIMGKLTKTNDNWNFVAIGDATEDVFLGQTIQRIRSQY